LDKSDANLVAFEGNETEVKLMELYLRNNGINCNVQYFKSGYRIYNRSKIFVRENDYSKTISLIKNYNYEETQTFKISWQNAIILAILAIFILTIIVSTFISQCNSN